MNDFGTYETTENLINRARNYWDYGVPIPLDLWSEMMTAGLDVVTLEQQYMD